ncbi:hypothetical protein ACFSJW_00570 [Flavobacterium artemisiae]|uniref:Uncharacterized protein n=1 Tax=Flavobacterium artemisiae TaxID=2126556 RepID=A0ABW4HHX6_9FLAO
MKKNFLSILIFLLGIQFLIGQNSNNTLNDWDKIIIIDAYHGWSSFENKLQIKKQDLWVTPLEKPDSIIKKIDPKLVNDLVKLIKRTNYDSTSFQKEPLISFGRDSLWLINNAEKLWKEHIRNREIPKEIDSIAISTIKNYQKANKAASFFEGSNWTDDYPFVVIGIIKDNDTITVHSNGQYPYMLPWYTKKRRIYDSKISELISQLLPDAIPSNKERMSGEGFNSSFIGKTYELFIAEKENYLEAKNKYPKTFKLLEKEFEITRAEIIAMSSIEWGRSSGRECLDMYLKDTTISKTFNSIQFRE